MSQSIPVKKTASYEPTGLTIGLAHLRDILDSLSNFIGRIISWLLLLMVFVTSVIVVLRYFFNSGSIGMQESVVYMHALVFLLGIPYALASDAHVRVDILYQSFSIKGQALINLMGTLLFLFPLALFVALISIDYVQFSWSVLESSAEPGGIPGIYLLKTLIPVSMVLLLLQGIAEICRSLLVFLDMDQDQVK